MRESRIRASVPSTAATQAADPATRYLMLIERRIAEGRERVGVLWRMAEQLSPKEVLKRGYAIVRGDDGRPVMTAGAAREQSALEIEFSDGRIRTGPRQTRSSRKESPPTPEQGKLL